MLSRTADNLYWLARYIERAEYLARILEVTQRLATLPLSYVGTTNEWELALATAGCAHAFSTVHPEATEETVIDFLCFSADNPSSIRSCFEIARMNARAVGTALTVEMWDAINGTWLELKRFGNGPTSREEFTRFLRWVQERMNSSRDVGPLPKRFSCPGAVDGIPHFDRQGGPNRPGIHACDLEATADRRWIEPEKHRKSITV